MISSLELEELVSEFKQVQKDMKFFGVDISVNETNKIELETAIAVNNKLIDEFPYARDLLADR